jgi:dipeptidyl aminopeptidase/acylaminoacyl peptidase
VILQWAKGNTIVFSSYHDGWPHLYSLDAGSPGAPPRSLTPGNFMCEHIRLSADKRFLVFSANTGDDADDIERRHVGIVSVDKADMRILTPGKGLEWTPVVTGDGKTLAFISATAQRPPLPAVKSMVGEKPFTVLGMIPGDFPLSKMVIPKPVTFKAADGVVVHADLFEPGATSAGAGSASTAGAGSPSTERRPAIIFVHGGPKRQMLLGWHYSEYYCNTYACNQYLANLGFVVLSVNYRLGIGYGYEFHRPAHGGSTGASEYQDIKAAGEWLARQNFVDPAKVGIYGESYGGFLTALALARDSNLFAAGVTIHGVHNWFVETPASSLYHDKYEKAPDYDLALKTAWLSSPVASIDTWKSPVLVIQGDDDRNVRFNQSIDLINRLEKKGVPYESLMIVDDTHHWMSFANAVTVYSATADFFVRKLTATAAGQRSPSAK